MIWNCVGVRDVRDVDGMGRMARDDVDVLVRVLREVMLVVRTQRARAELRDAQCGLGATVGVTGAGALLQSETKHQTD